MVEQTYYQLLGLEPTASPGAIKQRFRELAAQALPQAKCVPVDLTDEIFLYREIPHFELTTLDHFGPVGQETYQQGQAQNPTMLHCRSDITEWRPVVACT